MCQNLEWQLCALQGKLPGQGSRHVSFATPPAALRLEWWEQPSTHPTFPCSGTWCNPSGFTVGDVYFAEVATAFALCANRAALFALKAGELFERPAQQCELGTHTNCEQGKEDRHHRPGAQENDFVAGGGGRALRNDGHRRDERAHLGITVSREVGALPEV